MSWKWHGIEIPEKYCFKKNKKCTPDCPSYDLGWLYSENDDNIIKYPLQDSGTKEDTMKLAKEYQELSDYYRNRDMTI